MSARRRSAALVGTALLLVVGFGLVLAGIDLLRAPGQLAADDSRFQTAPRRDGTWDVGRLPVDLSELLLGLRDDLAYRDVLAMYVRVEPGKVLYEGVPELEKRRAKVQFDLSRMSREETDPKRKSRLLTLDAVMALDQRGASSEERDAILRDAATAFRTAIALDPTNVDAKTNLELVLSVFGPVVLPPNAPSQGADRGRTSGQGRPGSGY